MKIKIIGIPLDLGQSRRGVDMGPSAMRYADLTLRIRKLGHEVEDTGNISVPVREHLPEQFAPGFGEEIAKVCGVVYTSGSTTIEQGYFPLFLGGDHSLAVGTIGGVTDRSSSGVLWFDAHGDFNVPATSPNGNIHGMPVAILCGYGLDILVNLGRHGPKVKARDIILIGTRDLDYDEKGLLRESGIKVYTMREIDERGIGFIVNEALEHLSHIPNVHVSFDMDVMDPGVAPGVGTPAPGGLTYREAHLAMEIVADSGRARSMDIVEINPILDRGNTTAEIAVELVCSLMGQKIF